MEFPQGKKGKILQEQKKEKRLQQRRINREKNKDKINAQNRTTYHKHKEENNEKRRLLRIDNPDKYRKQEKQRRQKTPEKYRLKDIKHYNTHKLKFQAKAKSRIVPYKDICEKCGSTINLEKHHPDYYKPLEVITLCRQCHYTTHRLANREKQKVLMVVH